MQSLHYVSSGSKRDGSGSVTRERAPERGSGYAVCAATAHVDAKSIAETGRRITPDLHRDMKNVVVRNASRRHTTSKHLQERTQLELFQRFNHRAKCFVEPFRRFYHTQPTNRSLLKQ